MADNKETSAAVSEESDPKAEATDRAQAEVNVAETDAEGSIGSSPAVSAGSGKPKTSTTRLGRTAKVTAKAGTASGLAIAGQGAAPAVVKNILVLAAPFAAGQILDTTILLDSLLAFIVFSMAASGIASSTTRSTSADRRTRPAEPPDAAG